MTFKESQKKFRAFDPINKKFAFVGFDILGETTLFDLCKQYELAHNVKLKITQWTGLTDSKGVDIYEGDILEYTGLQSYGRQTVWYNSQNGMFQSGFYAITASLNYAKIIGNIYEAPELLK